jgi:hypothetical protein
MRGWQVLYDQIGSVSIGLACIADRATTGDKGRQAGSCRPHASTPVTASGQAQKTAQQRNRQNDIAAIDLGCVLAVAIGVATALRKGQQRDEQYGSDGKFAQNV